MPPYRLYLDYQQQLVCQIYPDEVKLGLIPGFGGTQRLARVIGRNRAREVVYTGKNIDAQEAERLGIVNKLYDSKEELLLGATETLKVISRNSINAVAKAKESILSGVDMSLSDALPLEAEIFGNVFQHHDAREGTEAFSEKRKAKFKHQI